MIDLNSKPPHKQGWLSFFTYRVSPPSALVTSPLAPAPANPKIRSSELRIASYAAWCGAGWIELIVCLWIRPLAGENVYVDALRGGSSAGGTQRDGECKTYTSHSFSAPLTLAFPLTQNPTNRLLSLLFPVFSVSSSGPLPSGEDPKLDLPPPTT